MGNTSRLKVGDRVIVIGYPYSWESSRGRVIGGPERIKGGEIGYLLRVNRKDTFQPSSKVIKVKEKDFMEKAKNVNMKKLKAPIIVGVVLLFLLILGGWLAGNFNDLVRANNQVKNSLAKIETQEQRRYDLIDNIVGSVKGAQKQEVEVFGRIADARKISSSPTASNEEKAEASQVVSSQVTALIPRLQEAYPELKSNDQVSKLIGELQGTEGAIAKSRDAFNDTANNYNTNIQSFPKVLFANMFGFKTYDLYKADEAANKAPKVNF